MPTDRNKDNVYEVTVRASDGAMHTDHMVMVTVTDDNEAPTVMGEDSFEYAENGKDPVATFTATDPEGATPITWSLATNDTIDGVETADVVDSGEFEIDDKDGMLKFSSPPDYEDSAQGGGDSDNDNTYHVVVLAADATGGPMGYHKITVKVTNVAETGKVTWTVDPSTEDGVDPNNPVDGEMPIMQFQVGAVLVASATDGDIPGAANAKSVTSPRWEWYRGSAKIDGQATASYTVMTEDIDKRLSVEVFYTVVNAIREESASLTSDYPVLGSRTSNDAPEFDPATVTREVSEGDKGMTVGAPVTATDDITNALNYTLAGADATRFEIDQKTGQIKTLVALDREGTADASATTLGSCEDADGTDPDPECTVTVTATDSAGMASSAATVTITITNVDEKPTFDTGSKMVSVAEGSKEVRADSNDNENPYAATDQDGLNVNLTLMGADGAKFQLVSGGHLSFKTAPDFEDPSDANNDNLYEVTVRASDGTLHADQMVKVTVTDVNEAPMILSPGVRVSGPPSLDYAEKGIDSVGTYTAYGSQAASARWMLEGDDAGDFRLSSSSGMSTMLMFRSSPNYEMPTDMNEDNIYMVTVKASYGSGAEMVMDTQTVTVYVTNMEEDGTVILSSMTPVVGTPLTANVTDLDVVMTDSVMWQWSRTKDGNVMDIGGATMMSYTPVAEDGGYYLRATATYTDGYGVDTAMATTASKVVGNRAPVFAAATATREVAEDTAAGMNIGAPVAATDPDGDTLTYSLSGTDEASFDIGESTGQLMTKAALDYETKRSYMVTVTATDPDDAADTIEVTINVITDVDEGPVQRYDGNDDGEIDIGELFNAIDDYFDEGLSISDLFEVIDAYFAG